jgi:hypothetical protein
MKNFTLILLVICCSSFMYEAAAKRKVTASVTVKGLTKAKIAAQETKLREKLASILNIDLKNINIEQNTPTATTTAAAVSAAPTTVAPTSGRRLAATDETTFVFSVIVASDSEATQLVSTLKTAKFEDDLLKGMKEVFTGETIEVNVASSSITNEQYTVTTTAAPTKGDVSGTTRTVVSSVLLSQMVLLLSLMLLQ